MVGARRRSGRRRGCGHGQGRRGGGGGRRRGGLATAGDPVPCRCRRACRDAGTHTGRAVAAGQLRLCPGRQSASSRTGPLLGPVGGSRRVDPDRTNGLASGSRHGVCLGMENSVAPPLCSPDAGAPPALCLLAVGMEMPPVMDRRSAGQVEKIGLMKLRSRRFDQEMWCGTGRDTNNGGWDCG